MMGENFSDMVVLGGNFSDEEIERIKSEWNKQLFYYTSSNEIKVIPIYQDRAIELLRRIVNDDPNPFVDLTDYGNSDCYFCSEASPNHKDDCPYLLAKQLLEEIDNGS